MISTLYKMGEKYYVNSSYLWSYSHFLAILCSQRHWVRVMRYGNRCTWTNIHQKTIKGSMRKQHQHSTKWVNFFVASLHIYRSLDISLQCCDPQDTESESCEIKMSIHKSIFTHKKIPKDIWDNDIHSLQDRRRILW